MAVSEDLMLAILAMDAYNRGYDAGVAGLSSIGQIGTATLGLQKGDQEAQGASFFAQAYTWNGRTIISYRGTDNHRAGDARIASDGGGQGFTIWPADRANPAGLKSALRDLRAGPLKDKDVKVLVREASGAARVATLTELAAEATLDRGATS